MRKSFQYRAELNRQTKANAVEWLDICHTIYNLALEQRVIARRMRIRLPTAYNQINELPALKVDNPEFKKVGSQVLQEVLVRVDLAQKAFFKRCKSGQKPGFPRFKSHKRYDSFTLTQCGWKLNGNRLVIKGIGTLKLRLSRPIEGDIKTITVRRTSTNKWFVSFSCDNVPGMEVPFSEKEIGIDLGIKAFIVDSDGVSVENPKYFRKSEKKLRKQQRRLARRKKNSRRREKARILVAKTHERIANQRKDFLHKTSTKLVKENAVIYFEELKIANMVKNRCLSKSISDVGWGTFIQMLTYKAEGAGRRAIGVNPKNTTQMCSRCGNIVPKTLKDRVHICPHCGLVLERDHNSAKNVLQAGQACQALTMGIPVVA